MYVCDDCGREYQSLTQDGCCTQPACFGSPLVQKTLGKEGGGNSGIVEGLCILVCDISASMGAPAFADHPAEKLRLVTGAIQRAIAELQHMARADTAYIAIVAFGKKAGLIKDKDRKPFFKSVTDIITEFGEGAVDLPTYLYPYFKEDKGNFGNSETDITEALSTARRIADCMIAGDLSPIGVSASARLMEHTDIITQSGQHITVPNIRVMIYSDGAHGSNIHRNLVNAFEDISPSPLMTAFIGDARQNGAMEQGAEQMRTLATTCPEHGVKGFFLIDQPQRYAVLRNLFRMASGASGFCEQCLRRDVQSFENVRE